MQNKAPSVTGQEVLDIIINLLSGEGKELDESMENMSEVQIIQAEIDEGHLKPKED